MQDVRVKVGESPCISTEATDDAITCLLLRRDAKT